MDRPRFYEVHVCPTCHAQVDPDQHWGCTHVTRGRVQPVRHVVTAMRAWTLEDGSPWDEQASRSTQSVKPDGGAS